MRWTIGLIQKHISYILLYSSSGLSEALCLYGLLMWTEKEKSHNLAIFIAELAKLYYLISSEGWRQKENCHHPEENDALLYGSKLIAGEF